MALKEDDLSIYLANVMLVAYADAALSAREEAALERIRQDVQAKKAEFTRARKLVDSNSHTLTKVGPLSAQVQNLEDMLLVGLAGGALESAEAALCEQFRVLIGLTEEQFTLVRQQVEHRLRGSESTVACPQCGQNAPSAARLCPNCGGPISGEQKVQLSFSIPDTGYAIEFADSTAANFSAALELAKKAFAYQNCLRGTKTWHLAVFGGDQFEQVLDLARLLGGIKNKKLYINGQEDAWDNVFGFVWCQSQRDASYKPTEFCFGLEDRGFNIWGCKQLDMNWTEWAEWFSFGEWRKGSSRNSFIWVFDKQRILHELNTKLTRIRYCPHLRTALIQAILELLPNEVNISPSSSEWEFKHSYEQVPGSVKIVEKEDSGDGISWSNEYFASGVKPKGLQFARRILREAFQRCGIEEPHVIELLK